MLTALLGAAAVAGNAIQGAKRVAQGMKRVPKVYSANYKKKQGIKTSKPKKVKTSKKPMSSKSVESKLNKMGFGPGNK